MVLLFLEKLWPKEGSAGHFLVPKEPDFQNEFKL